MSNINQEFMTDRVKHIHLIGVGGSGMSGIADVLVNMGYAISGSDIRESAVTQDLINKGAKIYIGHDKQNISGADVVVVSTAIDSSNPEVAAALDGRIPVIRRAEMLAELMRFRFGIAVAGTHGKTTTTSLMATVFAEAGRRPTFVIGGRLNSAKANAKLGSGKYLIAEADESDGTFLLYRPLVGVITNIDEDHMETYGGEFAKLKEAFIQFVHNLPFYGLAVVCADDPNVREILPALSRPVVTYGLEASCDIHATDVSYADINSTFTVVDSIRHNRFDVTLRLPGRHSVLNALAVISVALDQGIEPATIQQALSQFEGIGRRFQTVHDVRLPGGGKATVIDDYGHHPTEITAVLKAARAAWPDRRLVLAFQPHRFTRTRDAFDDFVAAVENVDVLFVTKVYAAGEDHIPSADGKSLVRAIRMRQRIEPIYASEVSDLPGAMAAVLEDGDVLLMMGAGDIGKVVADIQTRRSIIGDNHEK